MAKAKSKKEYVDAWTDHIQDVRVVAFQVDDLAPELSFNIRKKIEGLFDDIEKAAEVLDKHGTFK